MLSSGLLTEQTIELWAPGIAWHSSGLISRPADSMMPDSMAGTSFGSEEVLMGGSGCGRVGRFRVVGNAMYGVQKCRICPRVV